jgi:hypothetical protein
LIIICNFFVFFLFFFSISSFNIELIRDWHLKKKSIYFLWGAFSLMIEVAGLEGYLG